MVYPLCHYAHYIILVLSIYKLLFDLWRECEYNETFNEIYIFFFIKGIRQSRYYSTVRTENGTYTAGHGKEKCEHLIGFFKSYTMYIDNNNMLYTQPMHMNRRTNSMYDLTTVAFKTCVYFSSITWIL